MRSDEFIQTAANMLASLASKQTAQPVQANRAVMTPVQPELDDKTDQTSQFVAPLQQKLELLKKAVDVDSFYDDEQSTETQNTQPVNLTLNVPPGQSNTKIELTVNGNEIDELDQIKQLAGTPVAAVFDAGDDEPLDS